LPPPITDRYAGPQPNAAAMPQGPLQLENDQLRQEIKELQRQMDEKDVQVGQLQQQVGAQKEEIKRLERHNSILAQSGDKRNMSAEQRALAACQPMPDPEHLNIDAEVGSANLADMLPSSPLSRKCSLGGQDLETSTSASHNPNLPTPGSSVETPQPPDATGNGSRVEWAAALQPPAPPCLGNVAATQDSADVGSIASSSSGQSQARSSSATAPQTSGAEEVGGVPQPGTFPQRVMPCNTAGPPQLPEVADAGHGEFAVQLVNQQPSCSHGVLMPGPDVSNIRSSAGCDQAVQGGNVLGNAGGVPHASQATNGVDAAQLSSGVGARKVADAIAYDQVAIADFHDSTNATNLILRRNDRVAVLAAWPQDESWVWCQRSFGGPNGSPSRGYVPRAVLAAIGTARAEAP